MPEPPPPYLAMIRAARKQGSGVLVAADLVLTCKHVVERTGTHDVIRVSLGDESLEGHRLEGDQDDLALIRLKRAVRIEPPPWAKIHLGELAGEPAWWVGFPAGGYECGRVLIREHSTRKIEIEADLDFGASGGILVRVHTPDLVRLDAYCLGLLRFGGQDVPSSKVIPEPLVAAFLQTHGVSIRRDPPVYSVSGAFTKAHKYDDPRKYLDWLDGYTQQIDLPGIRAGSKLVHAYPMDDLYVSLKTSRSALGDSLGDGKDSISLDEALARYRRLVIQGEAGGGKTTYLRHVARQRCANRSDQTEFPVLVNIARLNAFIRTAVRKGSDRPTESGWWIVSYLESESTDKRWGLDLVFFEQTLDSPNTVVLLDGLDEAPDESQRESLARLFGNAISAFPECRWVVTTRPRAYEGGSTLRDFTAVDILPLDPDQIDDFLYRWSLCLKEGHEAAARDHYKSIKNELDASSWETRRLATNPLMLSALAVVHYNEKELPHQRAELYERIVWWLAKARAREDSQPQDLLEWYGYLALKMQNYQGEFRTRIGRGKAGDILSEEFTGINGYIFLMQAEIDSGIVCREGNDTRFYQRSFQEYMAARYLSIQREAGRWDLVKQQVLRPEWRETFMFLAGCLYGTGKDVLDEFMERLVGYGLELEDLPDKARIFGLMASMLSDVRSVRYKLREKAQADYDVLRYAVMRIFDPGGASLGVKERAAVADALGQMGDPRLRLPEDSRYWAPVGSFEIGRHPVTVYEYDYFKRYLDASGSEPKFWMDQLLIPSRPVVHLNWHQAEECCRRFGGRLPTTEEWEYAARGDRNRVYPWGDVPAPCEGLANFGMAVGEVTPVGLFPKGNTPDGVTDMAGNVWEWTSTKMEDDLRVVRGGSFSSDADSLRTTADRLRFASDSSGHDVGFRMVRDCPPS